jgi:hypothetical protein
VGGHAQSMAEVLVVCLRRAAVKAGVQTEEGDGKRHA